MFSGVYCLHIETSGAEGIYEATQPLEADEQAAKRNKRETQS